MELAANGIGNQESIRRVGLANEPQLDTGWSTTNDNLNGTFNEKWFTEKQTNPTI